MSTIERITQQAQEFRRQYVKAESGGYVIFFDGEAVGWKLYLDNPGGQEPGCIAVDDLGRQWVATGGDSYNGATSWEKLGNHDADKTQEQSNVDH